MFEIAVGVMIATASMFYLQFKKLQPRVDGEAAVEFELSSAFLFYVVALALTGAALACTTCSGKGSPGISCGVQTCTLNSAATTTKASSNSTSENNRSKSNTRGASSRSTSSRRK